jgi:superfamily II DNA or RNA helicase
LVLATGRYLGEGFDDASLDTLFLTMPISWKGTLAQYVGRLHREHHAKREVIVHDYVDLSVSMPSRMALKRQAGYRGLRYEFAKVAEKAPVGTGFRSDFTVGRGRLECNGRRRDVHCSTPVSPGDLNIAKFKDIRHPFNPRPLRTCQV